MLLGLFLLIFQFGCVSYRYVSFAEVPFRDRLTVESDGEVRVAAAVLSREESRKLFGANLFSQGVQPVWLEIENGSPSTLVFFMRSVDPHYFSPREAAHQAHFSVLKPFYEHGIFSLPMWPLLPFVPLRAITAANANDEMNEHFDGAGIGNESLSPGERIEGFVFTRAEAGTKRIPVSLVGADKRHSFTLFVRIPGTVIDYELVTFESIYPKETYIDHDWHKLTDRLQALPCCTTNASGSSRGDPVNLVIVGDFENILEAFILAGWDETERLSFASARRTARSFIRGESYRTSPVSNLYLFGRPQDFALQKARATLNSRNHLRLWRTPWRVEGRSVWIGQASRDIGVRLTWRTWNLTTHEIDPDVDDARDNVLGDLVDTGRVSSVGFIQGPHARTLDNPGKNLTGDSYFTDGEYLVVVVEKETTPLHVLDWHKRRPSKKDKNSSSRNLNFKKNEPAA